MEYQFEQKYTYDESVLSVEFDESQLGMLETYGPDLELAKKIHSERPNCVWSVVDGEDGGLFAIAGMHLVNCVYFIVTLEPFQSDDEEYLLLSEDPEESE